MLNVFTTDNQIRTVVGRVDRLHDIHEFVILFITCDISLSKNCGGFAHHKQVIILMQDVNGAGLVSCVQR